MQSWWLNALVITTVIWMWATLAAGALFGIAVVIKWDQGRSSADTPTLPSNLQAHCNYDANTGKWVDEFGAICDGG